MSDLTPTTDDPGTEDQGAPRPARRWAVIALGALVVLGAAELAARAIEPHVPEPDEWATTEIEFKVRQMDERRARGQVGGIVIAGSSQSWGLDPQVLLDAGVTDVAFNSAIPSATAQVQRRWLLEEVVPRLQPDVVVWGVSAPDLNETENLLSATYDSARATRRGTIGDVDRLLAERSALIRLRPVLGSAVDIDRALRIGRTEEAANTYMGDLGQRVGSTEYAIADDSPPPPNVGEWSVGHDVDDLPTTVRALQARGIEVVLVLLPVPQRTADAFEHGEEDWRRTIDIIGRIAEDLDVQLLDGVTGYSDDASFRDTTHLDAEASRAITQDIARALGGTPPEDSEPVLVSAMAPDAPVHPLQRVSLPRPGWVRIETSDPLTELGGTMLTLHVGDGGRRTRVRVELYPRRRTAVAEQLVGERWVQTGLPRTLAADPRSLEVEVPNLVESTAVLRIVVTAIGARPGGVTRLTPGIVLEHLRGEIATTGTPAWDLAALAVTPARHDPATLRREGDRLVWKVPAADGWTDELVLADRAGATTTITWDPARRTIAVRDAGGAGRLPAFDAEPAEEGWTITLDVGSLPIGTLDATDAPLTIGPRRRLDGERPLLAEGLDLVLR